MINFLIGLYVVLYSIVVILFIKKQIKFKNKNKKHDNEEEKFKAYNGNVKQYFIRFLKQHNAYEMFMYNFNSARGRKYRKKVASFGLSPTKFFACVTPVHYVYLAFIYGDTQEGTDFWKTIDLDWFKHYSFFKTSES